MLLTSEITDIDAATTELESLCKNASISQLLAELDTPLHGDFLLVPYETYLLGTKQYCYLHLLFLV